MIERCRGARGPVNRALLRSYVATEMTTKQFVWCLKFLDTLDIHLPPHPLPSLSPLQDWLTPENKQWPGSGRANEVQGDREVIATRYQVLISPNKKTAASKK